MTIETNYNFFKVANTFVDEEGDLMLSTECTTTLIDGITPELSNNLDIARETIQFVNKHILYSTTFPQRSKDQTADVETLGTALDILRDQVYPFLEGDLLSFRVGFMLLKKIGIGDCYEMTCVGLGFLLHRYPKRKVARCAIANGDHWFLKIGGGKDAVICDPWSCSYYPKTDLSKYLFDYTGTKYVDSGIGTKVAQYDPATQSISEYENPQIDKAKKKLIVS